MFFKQFRRSLSHKLHLSVDYPPLGVALDPDSTVRMAGWAFSEHAPMAEIEVFLGTVSLGKLQHSLERPDVAQTFGDQPNALHSGFIGQIHLPQDAPPGDFILTIEMTDQAKNSRRVEYPITILSSSIRMKLDKPAETTSIALGDTLDIKGWAFSEVTDIASIKVYLGNTLINQIDHSKRHNNISRSSTDTAYTLEDGFEVALVIPNTLDTGPTPIIVEVVDRAGNSKYVERSITLLPSQIELQLDIPDTGLKSGGIFTLSGRARSSAAHITAINAYIDDVFAAHLGAASPDEDDATASNECVFDNVLVKIPHSIEPGEATLTIEATDAEQHSNQLSYPLMVQEPPIHLVIDSPSEDHRFAEGTEIPFRGWAFSEVADIAEFNVYIDDLLLPVPGDYRLKRPDVALRYADNPLAIRSGFEDVIHLPVHLGIRDASLRIEIIDQQQNRLLLERPITINPSPLEITVESAHEEATYKIGEPVRCNGWVYSEIAPLKQVNVYLGNFSVGTIPHTTRQEAIDTEPLNGQEVTQYSEFDGVLRIPHVDLGVTTLRVEAVDTLGHVNSKDIPVEIAPPVIHTGLLAPAAGAQCALGNLLTVTGWAFSETTDIVSAVVYLEDKLLCTLEVNLPGAPRSDVLNMHPNAQNSGFNGQLRIPEDTPLGKFVLTVLIEDSAGYQHRIENPVEFVPSSIKYHILTPQPDSRLAVGGLLKFNGWAYSLDSEIDQINVYLSDEHIATLEHGLPLLDSKIAREHPQALENAFSAEVRLALNHPGGQHPLRFEFIDKVGNERRGEVPITIEPSPINIGLATPHPDSQFPSFSALMASGRIESSKTRITQVRLLVNDQVSTTLNYPIEAKAETTTPHSIEFTTPLSLTFEPGTYLLRVQAIDDAGNLQELTRAFHVYPTPIELSVDLPQASTVIPPNGKILISGWSFSRVAPITRVEIYVNGTLLEVTQADLMRPDVSAGFHHPRSLFSGFAANLQIDDGALLNTSNEIKVRVEDAVGNIRFKSVTGLLTQSAQPMPQEVILDINEPQPETTVSNQLHIRGWAFSQNGQITRIEVYLNDTFIGEIAHGRERPDVAYNYPNYPQAAYPGFLDVLDAGLLLEETATLTIIAKDDQNITASRSIPIKATPAEPTIRLERAHWNDSILDIEGWYIWSSSRQNRPITANIYLNGHFISEVTADLSRPELTQGISTAATADLRGFRFNTPLSPADYIESTTVATENTAVVIDGTDSKPTYQLTIEIVNRYEECISHSQTIAHQGSVALKGISELWSKLNTLLNRLYAMSEEHRLSVLDWHSSLTIDKYTSAFAVFYPVEDITQQNLPYIDDSFSVVTIASGEVRDEALRIARIAVIEVVEQDEKIQFEVLWKRLPTQEIPAVSIIIPYLHTQNDIDAHLERLIATLPTPFNGEIIVVTDAKHYPHHPTDTIKFIYREGLQNWADYCNYGAAAATHPYLIFLDSHVLPQADWLPHLLKTLNSDDQVGMVGGKILAKDGRIQEAGSLVFRDATTAPFALNLEQTYHPLVNLCREVDYCSSSTMGTTHELFEQLGGFEADYQSRTYTDVDYSFKVRQAGFKVIYQPQCQVISDQNIEVDIQFDDLDLLKLSSTWEEALQQQPLPPATTKMLDLATLYTYSTHYHDEDDQTPNNKRVLFSVPALPRFLKDSNDRHIRQILESFLAVGWQVTLFVADLTDSEDEIVPLSKQGILVFGGQRSSRVPDGYLTDLVTLLQAGNFDLIVLPYWEHAEHLMPTIQEQAPQTRTIVASIGNSFLDRPILKQTNETTHVQLNKDNTEQMRHELNTYLTATAVLTTSTQVAELINSLLGVQAHATRLPTIPPTDKAIDLDHFEALIQQLMTRPLRASSPEQTDV